MLATLFFYCALVGGTLLAFQFVLMLLGIGDDGGGADVGGVDHADFSGGDHSLAGDVHTDVAGAAPGDPTWTEAADADLGHPGAHWFYEMLSLRTLGAAVTFFGLAGRTAQARGMSDAPSLAIALLAGWGAMYGVYWLFRQVYKVQHSGNENIRLSVGLPATVYVPIPANRGGMGKVMFRLQDRTVEYQAVSDEEDRLATGEEVVVTSVINSDTVCVARVPQPAEA
jgi:hypothetical protein